jgi:F-type H+-transporting ATPase subunit delta
MMTGALVATRYAKALIDLSIEQKVLNDTYNDMVLINKTISENIDLNLLLKSPVVNTDKKQNILSEIFKTRISELSSKFLLLITSKKRENLVNSISLSFINQYKKANNIIEVELTSAVELEQKQKNKIISLINNNDKATIEIKEKINSDILGGFIVKIEDKQIDSSLTKEIRELRNIFDKNLYISEV